MDRNKLEKEHKRLEKILEKANIAQQQREVLAPVIDNMAWQRLKLDEAMEEMKDASIVCEYDNGGGQRGTRENPVFKAYINLWRGYIIGLEKFTSYLPKEIQEEIAGDNLIDQIRLLKKAKA